MDFLKTFVPLVMFNLIALGVIISMIDISHSNFYESAERLSLYILPSNEQKWFNIRPTLACSDGSPFLLTVVHSAVGNYAKRKAIRETWGHERYSAYGDEHRLIFVLGLPREEEEQTKVTQESAEHSDILQGQFLDTYYNLTVKCLIWMNYVANECNQVNYVLKTDDDAFVNVFGLKRYLRSLQANASIAATSKGEKHPSADNHIYCKIWSKASVERRIFNKWRVSRKEFRHAVYPPYCAGVFYFMEPQVIRQLYNQALDNYDLLWIDDVFVTGILAKKANITHRNIDHLVEYRGWNVRTAVEQRHDSLLFGMTNKTTNMQAIWNLLLNKLTDDKLKKYS